MKFKKGARVRIKDDEIDGFVKDYGDRMRGRVGVVTGHLRWSETPIVVFPAVGRKRAFDAGAIRTIYLELAPEEGQPG